MVQYVYAVAGAKGGVGKTTTSINLGTAFADLGWSVLVVETDLAMANLLDFLDVDVDPSSDPTLHDVLGDGSPVEDAIYEAPGDLDVLPSGVDLEGFASADLARLGEVVADLRAAYDVILLDAGAGLSRETLYPPAIADGTIVVSSPRVASVRDAEKTAVLAERVGGDVEGVLFVQSGTGTAPPVQRIADFLGTDLLGHVPEDEAVPISQDAGRPVLRYAADAPAAEAYRDIAADLESELVAGPDPDADETPSTVEADGGPTVAVADSSEDDAADDALSADGPDEPGDGIAVESASQGTEESPDQETGDLSGQAEQSSDATDDGRDSESPLADASDASDLLDGDDALSSEGSVTDLWETVERELEDDSPERGDATDSRDGMPDPPSESAALGSGEESTAEPTSFAALDDSEGGSGEAPGAEAGGADAGTTDDENEADGADDASGGLRALVGSVLPF